MYTPDHHTSHARVRRRRRINAPLLFCLLFLLILLLTLYALFGEPFRALLSLEREADMRLYTMTYKGDYSLDKLLETGVSSDAELVEFIVSELTHGIPLTFDLPDLGCSTFIAEDEDGSALFGRNFDMYDSPALLLKTEPKNGYRSISMVNLAYIGYDDQNLPDSLSSSLLTLAAPYVPMDGMNECGLAVSVMLIDTEPTRQQTEKIDLTTTAAIRMLLDKAATVEEAIDLIGRYDMHASAGSCYHFMVADASGASAVIEYIDNEMVVLPGEPVSTNFLLTPGEYDFGGGYDRYDTVLYEIQRRGGVMTRTEAMDTLRLCSQQPTEGKRSATQWSCVYNLDTRKVDVVISMDWDNARTFAL